MKNKITKILTTLALLLVLFTGSTTASASCDPYNDHRCSEIADAVEISPDTEAKITKTEKMLLM